MENEEKSAAPQAENGVILVRTYIAPAFGVLALALFYFMPIAAFAAGCFALFFSRVYVWRVPRHHWPVLGLIFGSISVFLSVGPAFDAITKILGR